MKTFLCEYRFRGAQWPLKIEAETAEEAKWRIGALGNAVLLGESQGNLPGWCPSFVPDLLCWWRNRR